MAGWHTPRAGMLTRADYGPQRALKTAPANLHLGHMSRPLSGSSFWSRDVVGRLVLAVMLIGIASCFGAIKTEIEFKPKFYLHFVGAIF